MTEARGWGGVGWKVPLDALSGLFGHAVQRDDCIFSTLQYGEVLVRRICQIQVDEKKAFPRSGMCTHARTGANLFDSG